MKKNIKCLFCYIPDLSDNKFILVFLNQIFAIFEAKI